jgi:hypothetical protein
MSQLSWQKKKVRNECRESSDLIRCDAVLKQNAYAFTYEMSGVTSVLRCVM